MTPQDTQHKAEVGMGAERTQKVSDTAEPFWPVKLLDWLEILVKVGLFAGGVFAALEYYERQQQSRVERVLGFIERFDSEPLVGARARILAATRANEHMILSVNALALDPNAEPAQVAQMWRDVAMATAVDSNNGIGVEAEISQVAEFFSGLEICVAQKVCDETTARAFFFDYAESFWRLFEPYAETRRKAATPNFARDLERFASRS